MRRGANTTDDSAAAPSSVAVTPREFNRGRYGTEGKQRRIVEPVMHVRTRPVLEYLGESNEKRCVWCLDQQNIVVSIGKSVREPLYGRTVISPTRTVGSMEGTPTSPCVLFGSRCRSTPCTPKRTQHRPPRFLKSCDQVQKSPSRPRTSPWLLPPMSLSTPVELLSDEQLAADRARGVECNSPVPSFHNISGFTFSTAQPTRRAVTPDVSMHRSARAAREDHFRFDFIHNEESTQEEVFEESVLEFVDMALLAQNISIVCYGPTGSGKTYSVIGSASGKRPSPSPLRSAVSPLGKQRTARTVKKPLLPLSGRDVKSTPRPSASAYSGGRPTGTTRLDASGTPTSVDVSSQRITSKALGLECVGEGTASSQLSSSSQAEVDSSNVRELSPQTSHRPKNFASFGEATSCGKGAGEGGGREFVCSEGIGLLPRLVLSLLDRCGSVVQIDRNEGLMAKHPFVIKRATNPTGTFREKSVDKSAHGSLLTLKDLTFYGVELYLDEFRDLLHPTKRRIPILGDIAGLDAFCQKLNEPAFFAGRRGGYGGGCPDAEGNDGASRVGGGVRINSVSDFHRCYAMAARNRVTKAHQCNDVSSRSHAIFILQLHFELTEVLDGFTTALPSPLATGADGGCSNTTARGHSTSSASSTYLTSAYSYVAVVDLAGSECVKQSKVEGTELREAQYINKSLSAFSAVLLALYQHSNHVPYRDSKLTRLLRPCLEHGRVLVLAHVSPCASKETLGALKFAEQLRHASVRSRNFLNATDDLVAVFEDLKDPDVEERAIKYRKSMEEYMLLCKEVRLAHFSKDSTDRTEGLLSETSSTRPSDGSLVEYSLEEASNFRLLPLGRKKRTRIRDHIISKLTVRHLQNHYQAHDDYLQRVKEDIKREQTEYINSVVERRKKDIEEMKLTVEKMKCCNAQLAEENSQPVLRDAHAMEIKQRLKDLAAEVTKCAGEKLLLLEGIRAIRQRTMIQEDLEQCLDEQLHAPPDGSALSGTSLQSMADSNFDDGMESIFNMQLLLSKEMSHLRRESTCFVRCDEIWEGLWARVMRQELMLAVALELEMMEGILLRPESIRWALESVGFDADTVKNVITPASADSRAAKQYEGIDKGVKEHVVNVSKLLGAIDKSLEQSPDCWNSLTKTLHTSGSFNTTSNNSASGSGEGTSMLVAPIPLVMSSGDEVKSVRNLTGCYGDEGKLQEACMEKLLCEGVYCELTFLPFGFDMRELFAAQRSLPPQTSKAKHTLPVGQWGVLRLVRPPNDASSYCLEFMQRTYLTGGKGRDRRLISIPLDEPQLRMSLHVMELDNHVCSGALHDDNPPLPTFPLIVLELKGVPPTPAQPHREAHQVQQQQVQEEWSSYLRGAAQLGTSRQEGTPSNGAALLNNNSDTTSTQGAILTKRLDCGGDLVLPDVAMSSCERGNGIFLLQFSDPVVAMPNRTESVECVVAALAGLTLPSLIVPAAAGAAGACPGRGKTVNSDVKPIDFGFQGIDKACDVHVATYNHMPHILLSAYGGPLRNGPSMKDITKPLTVPVGVGVSPLVYASTMGIFFYFWKDSDVGSSLGSSVATVAAAVAATPQTAEATAAPFPPVPINRPSPRGQPSGPFSGAINALVRLTSLTVPNSSGASAGNGNNVSGGSPPERKESASSDVEDFLLHIQKLQSMRKKVRNAVRQQIFDAEDIKAELLYSYSENEFMRGSHIKDVMKEARELIDFQQQFRGNMGIPARVPVQASPALCREMCKFFIPWTLWQWAHRWQTLQDAYRQQQQQLGLFGLGFGGASDTDSEPSAQLSPEATAASMGSLKILDGFCGPTICFGEIPCFLSGMM
ncbi:kinesin, putative [Trypanosoma brucei gambiense DAL972]|uniref:Kinesin, putative n=1 Tax=Trypanosoma brucei gambiense (strain MHOM/CI/86/DAL972) TaxID=679716 RepID=C9ZWG9_TRYB9|nr:kinesin, putative [Trypanosoma brucei gambiense DAL972]CBH13758.1 kinesin, putative [Trypanosoma brucei gambiense DAL972]|eukprot:XP_011776034.1 kinesin, putative [Trypanosoma brucei gambiense DAL972]